MRGAMADNGKSKTIPGHIKFLISGVSGMAAILVVQPLDLIKNRMQLSGEGGTAKDHKTSFHAIAAIVKKEGLFGLYTGLTANLFRQATYTTARMGIFQIALEHFTSSGHTGVYPQVGAGLLAGFIGAIIATPSDVRSKQTRYSFYAMSLAFARCIWILLGFLNSYKYNIRELLHTVFHVDSMVMVALVRMTANGKLPPSERRQYKHIFDALKRIALEEGRAGIFAGFEPSMLRTVVGNVTQLVSYMQAKTYIIEKGYLDDSTFCHFTSSIISGLIYSFVSCPLDVAKTRMQYMKTDTGKPLYSNVFDVFAKTVRKEGVTALWKGLFPLYIRIAPHTILLFVFIEKLNALYREKIMHLPPSGMGS